MYKIDRKNVKKERNFYLIFLFVGVFCALLCACILLASGGGEALLKSGIEYLLITIGGMGLLSGTFFLIGLYGVNKYRNKMKKYDYLEQYGRLVKGLKYHFERTNISVNGRYIMRIVAEYEMESGSTIPLFGDARFDYKMRDEDGLVDALIDPMDSENCYIDFNIEESY